MQFFVELVLTRTIRPEFSNLLCDMEWSEFRESLLMLALDMVVEIAIALGNYTLLRLHGLTPLRVLKGMLSTYTSVFLAASISANLISFNFQHSHWGHDQS